MVWSQEIGVNVEQGKEERWVVILNKVVIRVGLIEKDIQANI